MQMKYLLAQMALQNSERFFATFASGGEATTFLSELWTTMGLSLPSDQRIPATGVGVWQRPPGEGPAVMVLTLPPPAARNEAYLLAAVQPTGGPCRVFCLERAVIPSTGQELTFVSEFAAEGRSNWGEGGAPVAEEFADMLCRLVADPSARPLAFVPMRLT